MTPEGITIKTPAQLEKMRASGRLLATIMDQLVRRIEPGITTKDLDQLAEKMINEAGGTPAFKGYMGYPASICASRNEQVVHGIPNRTKLRNGDILSLDIGICYKEYYGDMAVTVPVGNVAPEIVKLLKVTKESLYKGIEKARAGNRLGDVSHAIGSHAERNGFSVVRDYVGHGIGKAMHEPPKIPNFGAPDTGVRLRPGMVLALEPMVNCGTYDVELLQDHWTVVTRDRKWSAHFEHSVAITQNGPQILTDRFSKVTKKEKEATQ